LAVWLYWLFPSAPARQPKGIARVIEKRDFPTVSIFKSFVNLFHAAIPFGIAFLFCGMIRSVLALVFLFAGTRLMAQDFPGKFTGHWQGELLWYPAGKKEPQKVKMQLIILPADTAGQFTWQLIYGDKNEDNRPYLLKPVDTARGHWLVDERNGILIHQYWIGQRLTNAFTVQSATILNSYWLEGNSLVAEFYSFSSSPVATTGRGTEEVPMVSSYGLGAYQKAILFRK
jgi:hypothetical protein